MNLKRQLLIVSLLTLVLPWAGCQFIAETESALRTSQQQMLTGTARAIADSLAQYDDEFPLIARSDHVIGEQLYAHTLPSAPRIDGYFDDWALTTASLREMRGADGPIRFALGQHGGATYLFVDVRDNAVIYQPGRYSDTVSLISASPPYLQEALVMNAEAPGPIVSVWRNDDAPPSPDSRILAHWQDYPGGYRVEARFPTNLLRTHLGLVVDNTADPSQRPVRSMSFSARSPGPLASPLQSLQAVVTELSQPGLRLTLTDANGWRIATAGDLAQVDVETGVASTWLRLAYEALVDAGESAKRAAPDPSGREQQTYIATALSGDSASGWFRDAEDGRAIVAVAQPITVDNRVIGAIVVQQGTEAILSLTNERLTNLMYTTVGVTVLVALALLGYATWLSRRIRRLSQAAEQAVDSDDLRRNLPSALDGDEVGDLSRSFAHVLGQLGEYNDYLRSLASKLSHELRTPLAIVSSSLENLEHETLSDDAAGYTARAKDGTARLRRILTAMSEASRVEELMSHAEFTTFNVASVLDSAVAAYRDIYPSRQFNLTGSEVPQLITGSPELLMQMLDKIVSNAVDFSSENDTISIMLTSSEDNLILTVHNPGPPLPDQMRGRLFDSMVSVREGDAGEHLGLGLYVSRLIAEGHGGSISADNVADGVTFQILLPLGEVGD